MSDSRDLRRSDSPDAFAAAFRLARFDAAFRLARVAAGMWLRTARWSVGASVGMARTMLDPRGAVKLANGLGEGLRRYGREFLGVSDLYERVNDMVPASGAAAWNGASGDDNALQAQAGELLRRSADVELDDQVHPAYARILEELAPDEGRILRLLALKGPQPSVDVRTGWLPVDVASELVAPGLTMIGAEAGCRRPERVHAYLNNLNRLGLI